jgi:hypothetical protein
MKGYQSARIQSKRLGHPMFNNAQCPQAGEPPGYTTPLVIHALPISPTNSTNSAMNFAKPR